MKHIVIIGNGIAGITTARHVRQLSDYAITVISAESDHFYSRTALMYIYMGHMTYEHTKPYEDNFWAKNRINLKRAYVEHVDARGREVFFSDGTRLGYDALVIATGSKPNMAGWPGQNTTGVQGLYSLQDLERMEQHTHGIQRAVVVGGGLIGVEMVEMLHSRQIPVTFLVREKAFWHQVLPPEESDLIERHLRTHQVDVRLNTELAEILPDENGRVRGVVTKMGEMIPGQFVGLTVGVSPNVGFLNTSSIALGRGVLVNRYFETNVPNVYAIGDCAEINEPITDTGGGVRKRIEPIWYTGRMHGETLAQTLCGRRTAYQPGVFFNSAKFFDIEYQTYGVVNPHPLAQEGTFYWEHASRQRCLRVNYDKGSQQVRGIHAFGLRLRHAVCERWIREKRPLPYVLEQLAEANFDPEFFARHEPHIRQQYSTEADVPLRPKVRRGLLQRLFL